MLVSIGFVKYLCTSLADIFEKTARIQTETVKVLHKYDFFTSKAVYIMLFMWGIINQYLDIDFKKVWRIDDLCNYYNNG